MLEIESSKEKGQKVGITRNGEPGERSVEREKINDFCPSTF